jgi:hypothetical protein
MVEALHPMVASSTQPAKGDELKTVYPTKNIIIRVKILISIFEEGSL